jgi:hypothetical protein
MTPTALPRNFSISNLLCAMDEGPLPLSLSLRRSKKHANGGCRQDTTSPDTPGEFGPITLETVGIGKATYS